MLLVNASPLPSQARQIYRSGPKQEARSRRSTSSKTGRDLFIGVYRFLADRRKRQSGSLRPVPAFRNAELSSPQEEASDLTAGTAAGADDELRQPVRAHAQTRREQMRRRSQFVRTAPPASTQHVQPSDVCFHLAALPNSCSSVVGPYRMLSHLSDTWGPASIADIRADIGRGIKFQFINAADVSRRTFPCPR